MPARNVNLTDHDDCFIETSINEGRFANASEAVHAGLHLLKQQDAEDTTRLESLRAAVQVGVDQIDRGEGIGLASIDHLAEYIHSIGDEVSKELAAERARG